mgnify:CR=1 FL=1
MASSLPCLHKPVYTTTGRYLGRVADVEVDALTHQVVHYLVAPLPTLQRFLGSCLTIAPRQVVRLTVDELTVDDLTVSPTPEQKPSAVV